MGIWERCSEDRKYNIKICLGVEETESRPKERVCDPWESNSRWEPAVFGSGGVSVPALCLCVCVCVCVCV